jgi:hypothetical protein
MNPNLLGIDRLAALENGDALKGFWVGRVVDDGSEDSQGRITARIEALFGDKAKGIQDADLPKLQMMPTCGLYVRPQKGDFVTVVFQGSVYEGFYVGHTVNSKSGTFGADLGEEFVMNFHNSYIRGMYDGSEFEINVNSGKAKIKINGKTGAVDINGESDTSIESKAEIKIHGGKVTIDHSAVVIDPKGGPFCALPRCLFTDADHQGKTVA